MVNESKAESSIYEQQTSVFNSGTLIGLAALVDLVFMSLVHVNHVKERRQNAPLPETTPTWNGFDYLPLTRTQTSGWQ